MGDTQEVDDLVQDTLVRAWKSRSGFRGDSEPTTWVSRIAKNQTLTHLKKMSKRRREETVSMFDEVFEVADPNMSTEDPVVDESQFRYVGEWIEANLTPRLRDVALLKLAGLDYKEIGDELDIKPTTAKMHMHRARRRMSEGDELREAA